MSVTVIEKSKALVPYVQAMSTDPTTGRLMEMLSYMRPAFSKHEKRFIRRYIQPTGAEPDLYGNYILRIGTAPILWSSHTDTVHSKSGFLSPTINEKTRMIHAHVDADCLGADCTAGVWLMLEMIKSKVEGLYVFHRAEEEGAKGSKFISSKTPELLDNIKFAIAFDRFGTDSIITHQMGTRGCSETFSKELASIMYSKGLNFESDNTGMYTDTAFYSEIVPECTNLSVGYYSQHTKNERLDLVHLFKLRNALISSDFTTLVAERDPSVVEEYDYTDWTDYRDQDYYTSGYHSFQRRNHYHSAMSIFNDRYINQPEDMTVTQIVSTFPYRVSQLLKDLGYDNIQLLQELEQY